MNVDDDSDALHPIEWFFRVRAGWKATLDLDELIIRNDLSDDEKDAAITQHIDTTVRTVTNGAQNHGR